MCMGDTIMAGIIVDGATTFSLSGSKISDFAPLAMLNSLRNHKRVIISSIGGNDWQKKVGQVSSIQIEMDYSMYTMQCLIQEMALDIYVCTTCTRYTKFATSL